MSKCAAGDVTFSWGGVEFKAPPPGEYPQLEINVGGEIELEDNGEVSKAEGVSIMGAIPTFTFITASQDDLEGMDEPLVDEICRQLKNHLLSYIEAKSK